MRHRPSHRTGGWLSQDSRHQKDWLKRTIEHVDSNPKDLLPVIQEFKEMVETDSRLYMLFHEMFEQIPKNKKHLTDPSGDMSGVRDFNHVLKLLNHIISTAPSWTDSGHSVGVVGVPINALLEWPMATPAGFTAFQDPKVNGMIKKVLDTWGEFLKSEESAHVLDESNEGWFGPTGKKSLASVANVGKTELAFEELFECDPSKPHHGFKSWDHWVGRRLQRHFLSGFSSSADIFTLASASSCFSILIGIVMHPVHTHLQRRPTTSRLTIRRQHHCERLRVDDVQGQYVGESTGQVLGERAAIFRAGHASERSFIRHLRGRDGIPGFPVGALVPSLALAYIWNHQESIRRPGDVLL